jgi:hypothetical protein
MFTNHHLGRAAALIGCAMAAFLADAAAAPTIVSSR